MAGWPLAHLKAWTMTVPKRMKRAEKMRDSSGIISRLEAEAAVSPHPLDWGFGCLRRKSPKPNALHTQKYDHKTGCF